MWCAFEGRPWILRAYGTATAIHRDDPAWSECKERVLGRRSEEPPVNMLMSHGERCNIGSRVFIIIYLRALRAVPPPCLIWWNFGLEVLPNLQLQVW